MEELKQLKKEYPYYIPNIKKGLCIDVYDGDTVTVLGQLENSTDQQKYKFKVRLNGIDCAEMKTKDINEKIAAIIARDILREKILGKEIELHDVSIEKYGRLLCTIFLQEENINQWMIEKHLAVQYNGGTKQKINYQ